MQNTRHIALRALVWSMLILLFFTLVPLSVLADEAETTHTLYSGPSTRSASVSTFSDGDIVTVLDRTNADWARIVLENGTVGYCDRRLLGSAGETEVLLEAFTTAKTRRPVSLRSAAAPDAPVIGKLAANAHVVLDSEEKNGYCAVTVSGISGYLLSDNIMRLEPEPAIIRTVPQLTADGAKTETEAHRKLQALSTYFEDGRYWNYIGTGLAWGEGTAFSVTDTPCAHAQNGYDYCNVYNGVTSTFFPQYGIDMQCLGYAGLISDLVFGTDAPISVHYDLDAVRVGDHIRLVEYEHSMIVTDTGTRADGTRFFRVTEVNADYENCEIEWGRLVTENDLYALGDIVEIFTRYEN